MSFQTLGNHEFDDGIGSLVSYLKGIQGIPTVVSNLNMTLEPDLNKLVLPSLVLTINNTKVGIVGYLTTETPVSIFIFLLWSFSFGMRLLCGKIRYIDAISISGLGGSTKMSNMKQTRFEHVIHSHSQIKLYATALMRHT